LAGRASSRSTPALARRRQGNEVAPDVVGTISTSSSTGASASLRSIFWLTCVSPWPAFRAWTSRSRCLPQVRRPASHPGPLSAADPEGIEDYARKVVSLLKADPEILDISDGLPIPGIDWELEVNRIEAAKYGIGPGLSERLCNWSLPALKLTDYRPAGADDAVDIRLRLPEDRRTLATLDQLRIETATWLRADFKLRDT
jgi:hypothetical protein